MTPLLDTRLLGARSAAFSGALPSGPRHLHLLFLLAFVSTLCFSTAAAGVTAKAFSCGTSDDLGEIKTALRNSNKFVRKDAVEDLAKRGEVEAWSLLLGALEDPAGEVADSAAYFLAGLPSDRDFKKVRKSLFGKGGLGARSIQVRRYAAELIGRMQGPWDFSALTKALKDKDGTVRRLLAFSIERLAVEGAIPDKDRKALGKALGQLIAKDKDPLVRARALVAQVALFSRVPEGEVDLGKLLQRAVGDKHTELRAAAAYALSHGSPPVEAESAQEILPVAQCIANLVKLSGDSEVPVRVAAVRGLGRMVRAPIGFEGRRTALRALAERLAKESESALAWQVLGQLRSLSGRKSGLDPRSWRAWVERLEPDWTPLEELPDADRGPGSDDRSASIVGLPIRSGSVAFLIDFSGSTWRERADGQTVKQILDGKLREALEALPRETRFLLVPFTGDPKPWREELVSASPRNVQKALTWFEKASFSGTGDAWDALLFAQDVEGVDTIVLLSDGAPSGGVRYRLELIISLLEERNLGRQIFLDCVLADAPKKLQRFWGQLCRATGGRVHAISL